MRSLFAILAMMMGCVAPVDSFESAQGGRIRLPGPEDCRALVLLFITHDCPISNSYIPELSRLRAEFSPRGAAFVAVYAESDLPLASARKHSTEFQFPFPAILDPELSLARRSGATVTPQAAVLSPEGKLLYLGRIDDRFYDFRKQRTVPEHHDLRDALEAVLSDRPIPMARTEALGCAIYFPKLGEKQ